MLGAAKTIITESPLNVDSQKPLGEILVTIYGANLGQKVDLDPQRTTVIGRDSGADIVTEDDSVSRRHCQLTRDHKGWMVEDLRSTNGTWLGGRQIQKTRLCDGDLLKVGSTIYKYLVADNIEAVYHQEIYRMAIFDGLTQIHNRRYLMEFVDREFARARRHWRPLSVLIFDVDHFKNVNDRWGHLSGDYTLRHLASLVRDRVRKDELFARYAGDEFMIILPETKPAQALEFGTEICSMIHKSPFVFDGHHLPVTVSVGMGSLTQAMGDTEALLSAADAALYRAKARGRNCVSA